MQKLKHRVGALFLAAVVVVALLIAISNWKEGRLKKDLERSTAEPLAARQIREALMMKIQNEGFINGHATGIDSAVRVEVMPGQEELHEIALRAAVASSIHPDDQARWVRGFEAGFSDGFQHVVKPGP